MKNLMLILMLFTFSNLFAQVQPPECSEPGGDTEAPVFTVPDPCDTIVFPGSDDCVFPNFESVPELWNQPGTAVADIVFETMTDNCMMVYWPPCWCSATMSSGVLDMGEDWIIYTFTAYDVSGNSNTQDITFHWSNEVIYDWIIDEQPAEDTIGWIINELPADTSQPRPQMITSFSNGKRYQQLTSYPQRIEFMSDGYKIEYIIYPNPSSGAFSITPEARYEVLDLRGKTQNVEYLDDGIYLIRINGKIIDNKLIIKR